MVKSSIYIKTTLLIGLCVCGVYVYTECSKEHIDSVVFILLTLMLLVGIAGAIGRYLNNKDMKQGYCDLDNKQHQDK